MSLVGLDVSFDGTRRELESNKILQQHNNSRGGSSSGSRCPPPVDPHPCVTPPGPAEMLFMSNLPTQIISAAALAQQIHSTHSQRSGVLSVSTDDFCTAASGTATTFSSSSPGDTLLSPAPTSTGTPSSSSPFSNESDAGVSSYPRNIFPNDVLTQNCCTTTDTTIIHEQEEDEFQDATMSIPTSSTTTPLKINKFIPTEAPQHVDAAEKVYDTAKGVWAWGKSVGILQPILGLAEDLAGKAVGATGNTMEGIDGMLIDQLHGFDDNLLNPAIATLVGILLGAAGKSEEVLLPILLPMLKQFKLIKETPEIPEITPDVAVSAE